MIYHIPKSELEDRINLNFHRLAGDPYYMIGEVFSPDDYDWYGDKEGRALLAFMSHYKISRRIIPCMPEMLEKMPEKLNKLGYMGPISPEIINEQQLSGHSWLLRGLCEHYERFRDDFSLETLKSVTENLFLPTSGRYGTYPVDRATGNSGGVSGENAGEMDGWLLSTDVGCAFMSIDGLSHVYAITRDARVLSLLDEMISVYCAIDKVRLKVQTHCTLTAARGMMRLYRITGNENYLVRAREIYGLYTEGGGMTNTYQNLNWWGRPDTWTEPCAIIDSLMLSLELYKVTGEEKYRTMAARVYHNGFATLQRDNGGAGTDTVVTPESPWNYLSTLMYEAPFCCSMRLAEGLWYINENQELLWAEITGSVTRGADGIYRDGDIIYAIPENGLEKYASNITEVDGLRLAPLVKYYKLPREAIDNGRQTVIFG